MELRPSIFKKTLNKLPVLLFDSLSIPISWYVSYWLRYNLEPFPLRLATSASLPALFILIVVQIGCFYKFKIYRGLWQYSSVNDVLRILRSVIASIIIVIPLFYWSSLLQHVPRSVLPIYGLILTTMLCGARLISRLIADSRSIITDIRGDNRVLIIGAGQAGDGLIRDLKRTSSYTPVGIIDDDKAKNGLEIRGIRVLGTTQDLSYLVEEHKVDLILIAIPSARSSTMRRIVKHCESCNVPFRTLPSLQALTSGHVAVDALRNVNIEDLLGRDQVQLDWNKISSGIAGKRVLITGAGGSIGSELCRQIGNLAPVKIMVIDNSEFNLYKIERDLLKNYPSIEIQVALISVTDHVAVESTFSNFQPEIVFHAAAYKHVPMLENQIRVAILNNVLGTKIVAQASVQVGADKFVLISTDKAVNPTNIMGSTKRVAEIFCQNLDSRVKTKFITVRFGNVLGSVGSVVPIFKEQISEGGPITVTHPEMERYFMTIPEACQLILQAMVNGQGSEIFVLDMGEPVKISYLAEQMIRLSGKIQDKDISIEYTGLRPGEKLYEELFHKSETLSETEHEKLFKACFRAVDWEQLIDTLFLMQEACKDNRQDELMILLKSIVPEFNCQLIN